MMRQILFFIFLFGVVSDLLAQELIQFTLKAETPEKKEIQLVQPNADGINDFKILLNAEWKTVDGEDRIILTFDRTNSDGEGLIACFPLFDHAISPKKAKSCNSISKRIYKGKGAKSVKKIRYFLQSTDIQKEYRDCYRFVAINNKEEFEFNILERQEMINISLNNLYVMREAKRPWYKFSKRDMKLEYQAKPVNIQLKLNRVCELEENVSILKDITKKVLDLEELLSKSNNALNAINCQSQLRQIQNELKNYPIDQPGWSDSQCDEIQAVYSKYRGLRDSISSMRCKGSMVSRCPDLKEINKRLMNLQMQIYAKKKDGKDVNKERKEFLNIKNNTDAKITPDCNKDLLSAYKSFCTYIEEALGK